MSSSATYDNFEGEWPVLGLARQVPASITKAISSAGNGSAISQNLGYFSLGYFFINADLIEPHITQRPIDTTHTGVLKEDFIRTGIFRTESPGVVIGLGDGWNQMYHSGPESYMIDSSSPHLHRLSLSPQGPVAQVIRGGHRTEAVKQYARMPGQEKDNYWYYNVLLPVTNNLPYALLHDYSCLDNIEKTYLTNSYHRTCLSYAQIAEFVYSSSDSKDDSTAKIHRVVKRNHKESSLLKITSFRHMLKFKEAVPHLIRLLGAGGVWSVDCEQAYSALLRCHVERAIVFLVAAFADQAELINHCHPNASYHITELLPSGIGDISKPKYLQAFTKASKKDMSHILNFVSTPLAKALDKAVWQSKTAFGSIFFNPVMGHRVSSPIGTYLKCMKNIYCVIILYFTGPEGLDLALPQGGQYIDDWPVNDANFMEGLIIRHWNLNKNPDSVITNRSAVSSFIFEQVSLVYSQLEDDRSLNLNLVPTGWKNPTPNLLDLLKDLLTKSQTWKGLIRNIKHKIMPLYPAYKHLCSDPKPVVLQTPQPNASSSRPQAISPDLHPQPLAPAAPIPSSSAQPTSAEDKKSLQIKTELLRNPALVFKEISATTSRINPQSPTASESRNPTLLEDGFEYLRQTPFNVSSQKSATAYFGQTPPSPLRWTTDPVVPWKSPVAFNYSQPLTPAPLLPSATINPSKLRLASAPRGSPFIPSQRQASSLLSSPFDNHRSLQPLDGSNEDDPMEDKDDENMEDKDDEGKEEKDDKDKEDKDEEDEEEKDDKDEEEKDDEDEESKDEEDQEEKDDKDEEGEEEKDNKDKEDKDDEDKESKDEEDQEDQIENDKENKDDRMDVEEGAEESSQDYLSKRAMPPSKMKDNQMEDDNDENPPPNDSDEDAEGEEDSGSRSGDYEMGDAEESFKGFRVVKTPKPQHKHKVRMRQKKRELIRRDGNNKGKQKKDMTEDESEEEMNNRMTLTPPPPNQQSLRPIASGSFTLPLPSFDEYNNEASSLFIPDSISETGLTSDEGSQILAALLALSQDERALVLDIEHGDLVSGFRSLIRKRPRSLTYTLSPGHKRSRH